MQGKQGVSLLRKCMKYGDVFLNMWSYVTGFFHLAQCFQDSSML